jgi:hypothetical protein
MRFSRLAILGIIALLTPACIYAKRTHVAMSTQKAHPPHMKRSNLGPYLFGGKLSKSHDHKFHPVKRH